MNAPRRLRDLLQHDTTLPCGRDVDDLLEQVADGRADDYTQHQLQCPHCQAALRELTLLWRPVTLLANDPVALPASVRENITGRIQRLVADTWYTLQLTDGGQLRIAARVVARVARDTARAVPGVRAALGRTTERRFAQIVERATFGHKHPHAAVGVLGRTAVVDLAVAATYGTSVDDIGREIQRRVIAQLTTNIGLQDVIVNVTVDDILSPPVARLDSTKHH